MYKNAQEYIEAYERGELDNLEDFPLYVDNFLYKICNRYKNVGEIEDLYSIAWIAILENIHKYDSKKGMSVLGFIRNIVEKKILSYYRYNKSQSRVIHKHTVSLNAPIDKDNIDSERYLYISHNLNYDLEGEALYNIYRDIYYQYSNCQHNKKIRTILLLSFEGYSQNEVSRIIGTSRPYVQKVLRDHRRKLRKLLLENEILKSKLL